MNIPAFENIRKARTTEDSKKEGRLKVDVNQKKKKMNILHNTIRKVR